MRGHANAAGFLAGAAMLGAMLGATLGPALRAAAADELYHERYRPQFHYTPPQQWMNDPNGMVFEGGEFHLFYQYNPYANRWGPMHWGHAVSRDLLHWQTLPIALFPDRLGAIFSGSAVVDAAGTAGFGAARRPALVAMYTSHDHLAENLGRTGYESQGIAYSLDHGRNWTKYRGNPVLASPERRDFRDPKLLWHAPTQRWIAALAAGDHIAFYSSRDLRHWRHESDFGQGLGAHGGVWECPDLIDMAVAGEAQRRQVLLVSVGQGAPNGGSGTQYFIGRFDGHRFTADAAARWLDFGPDDYAGSTWSGGATRDGRPRFIGWMSNWQYAADVPTDRWRGAMTLPRELLLARTADGLELHSWPAAELAALRGKAAVIGPRVIRAPFDLTAAAQTTGGLLEMDLDLDLKPDAGSATAAELAFANRAGERAVLRLDGRSRRFELDRRASGAVDFNKAFAAVASAPWEGSDGRVRLRIYLDASSIEVFIDGGATVFTALVFPRTPYDSVTLGGEGTLTLNSAVVYELSSAVP